jgi:membrane protein implicated in regulation of membrane protease activity
MLLMALDVYLVGWRWSDVGGNVEAQFIIVTPQFIALHLLSKRRAERHQAETQGRLDAQDHALAELHQRLPH